MVGQNDGLSLPDIRLAMPLVGDSNDNPSQEICSAEDFKSHSDHCLDLFLVVP